MIKLKNMTKKFDDFIALDCVDLEIPKGIAYGLLGSNGAGKSTILRLVSGVYKADIGEVMADDKVTFENPEIKEKIYFVNDETVQWNNFTLEEMKDYHKRFYGNFSSDKFYDLWNVLKLPMDKKLATFSKGMKRQAVVINALATQPSFLLMDEAFDGLDPTMRSVVKGMLFDSMLDNDMTAIISSHNLKEIDEFCDRAGLLHKGKIVFNRELDSLKGDICKIQVSFSEEISETELKGKDIDILKFDKTGSVYYIIARGKIDEIKAKMLDFNPILLDAIPLSLEEIFIYEMEVLGYEYTSGIDGLGD